MKLAVRGVFTAMTLRTASALAALAATLVVAGCGSDDNDSAAPAAKKSDAPAYDYDYGKTPSSEATPEAVSKTGKATTIQATSGPLGSMLVDAEGRTLYLWEADKGGQSACDGPCAAAWPPLTTTGKPTASGDGVNASLLGTAKRADGTLGVTYAGHPLYHFKGDGAAGDANGQGSDGFGAKWWVVSPGGAAIEG
jgi:predicted lipoprotein with Yx(FWY)xxD motif